jgi:hypothetical protein
MARPPRWRRSRALFVTALRREATARRLPRSFTPPTSSSNDPRRFDAKSPAYQQAQALAQGVFNGTIQDQTNGATHFVAPAAQADLGRSMPNWAKGDPLASIGGHQFYAPNGAVGTDKLAAVGGSTGPGTAPPFSGRGRPEASQRAPRARQQVRPGNLSCRIFWRRCHISKTRKLRRLSANCCYSAARALAGCSRSRSSNTG